MDSLFDLPPIAELRTAPPGEFARARKADPETSREAAVAASKNLTAKQDEVFAIIKHHGPVSDEQIHDFGYCAQSPSGMRTRRSELVAKGLVVHDGFDVTSSGNRTRLWVAVDG